jgi:hypothetical protein
MKVENNVLTLEENGNHLNHVGLFNEINKVSGDCRMMQLSIDVLELQVKFLKSTVETLQRRLDFLEKSN